MDVRALVAMALEEDLGPGDLTTEACVDATARGEGILKAKQELVVCGHAVVREVFAEAARRTGGTALFVEQEREGALVKPGTIVGRVRGHLRALLIGERTALNFAMRLSGIATNVRRYVEAAGQSGPRIVDTRKTTPLHRQLEKHAVKVGGAQNHRFALFDGILIKDNHIAAVGGITEAIRRAKAHAHHLLKVEVEVSNLAQVDEALAAGADALLLDNMDDAGLASAIHRVHKERPNVVLEASGNMDPERIARIKDLGLDLVSAGGLIHQARWADLSLKIARTDR